MELSNFLMRRISFGASAPRAPSGPSSRHIFCRRSNRVKKTVPRGSASYACDSLYRKLHMTPKAVTLENEVRWPSRIVTAAEALKYINAVGYCVLYPVKNVPLASLYYPVTRRNPHKKLVWDKYSMMIWRWKDDLPRRRRAFYAKYFRGRGTFISLHLLPHFLAIEEAAVSPSDHERVYAEGRIRADARTVWEALAKHGPMATLELRHACRMETKAGNVRFKRAILELQRLLIVVHFGSEQETGAWASGRFELTCRAFPGQVAESCRISPTGARAALAAKYFEWYPSAPSERLAQLFRWTKAESAAAIAQGPIQGRLK